MSRSSQRERTVREKARKSEAHRAKGETPPTAAVDPFPSRFMMEQMMREIGLPKGKAVRRDAAWRAQELAYKAMEASTAMKALELANRALETDPRCLDALTLMAQAASGDDQNQLVEHMERIVETGRRTLGKKFFEENEGIFWGVLETRPYMRAHAYLAQVLAENGRWQDAIGHYEQLLKLNPGDNQGLRYCLLNCYLQVGLLDGVRRLFCEYEDEDSAVFLWSRVLERFLSGDAKGAGKALAAARKENKFVEPFLSGTKKIPRRLPDYYGFGDENEGIMCADCLEPAWRAHPLAVE